MLLNYSFKNLQSFAERVEVDLTVSRKTTLTDWIVDSTNGYRVSKLMAIIGHNASGKTILLKPIAFISWFVRNSFSTLPDSPIPFSPHALFPDTPSEFECIFDDKNGTQYRYVLHCTPKMVLYEALYQKRERYNYIFIRDWNAESKSYSIKQQDFGLLPKIAKKVRANVSLISWAAQNDVPLAKQLASIMVISNVNVDGKRPISGMDLFDAAEYFYSSEPHLQQMKYLLSSWDLGLSNVELREFKFNPIDSPDEVTMVPIGFHLSTKGKFELPFFMESSGTQAAFILLSRLLPVLEHGGLAVIDELENDLHPLMLEPILSLFADPKTNPKNAQLIFSTHSVEVLNLVEKSQVMLVEKNENCVSEAYRLDSIEGVRNDDNFHAKYLAGAYGAIPRI